MNTSTEADNGMSGLESQASALVNRAWKLLDAAELDEARELALQAIELATAVEPIYEAGMTRALVILAECGREEGQYDLAIHFALQAKTFHDSYSHPDEWTVRNLYILANAYDHLGDPVEALQIHQQQFELAKQIENTTYQATALRRIGVIHASRGQKELAREYYEKCLDLYQSSADNTGLPGVLNNLSGIYREAGDTPKALEYAKRSLALHESMHLIAPRVFSHSSLSFIFLELGDIEQAQYHMDQALAYSRQSGRNYPQIVALRNRTKLNQKLGIWEAEHLEEALDLAVKADDLAQQAACHRMLAELYEKTDHVGEALSHFKEFHEIKEQLWTASSTMRFEAMEIKFRTNEARADAAAQRRLREEEQRNFERISRMKDEFVSTASHDLKNPLTNIGVSVYLLDKHGEIHDERGQELLRRINRDIELMRELVENVLDLARIETGITSTRQFMSAVDIVRDIVNEFRISEQIESGDIDFQVTEPVEYVAVNPQLIKQALRNLMSNAIKYSGQNGRVQVSIDQGDSTVDIKISDNGIGIPASDLPHIFERFYRVDDSAHRSVEGTGLGLAIVKSVVDQHNGTISVVSSPGFGSSFTIRLPSGRASF